MPFNSTATDRKDRIIDQAIKLADFLISHSWDELNNSLNTGNKANKVTLLQWNNPENIETGISGILLYLMEVYEATKTPGYLSAVEQWTGEVIAYCKHKKTVNYSLYTGRSGVVYALLQLYEITGKDELINECVEIIGPANGEFLQSAGTSAYLYDGLAGTLLVIAELFYVSRQPILEEYMREFSEKIISTGILSAEGLSWKTREEINLKNSCGFAFGTAGIRYSLHLVNQFLNDVTIRYLIARIDSYTDACWIDHYSNWGCFERDILTPKTLDRLRDAPAKDQGKAFEPANETGWVRGTAGILLSFLHRYPFESDSLFKQAKPAIGGDDFLGGDAGMGIYHMNRYRLTGAPESLECVNRLADFFIPRIDKEFFTVNGGLFCSDLVIAYFLMNVINIENGTDNVFAPFLTGTSGARATCFDKKPRLKIGAVRKRLLYRYFGRTIDLMDTFAPKVLNSYLDDYREEETGDELDRFIGFVGSAIEKITAAPAYDPLKDLFGFELNKYKAICSDQRTNIHIYLDNLSRCDATIGLLNNSDSWLFGQKLAVSRQIKSVQSKWDWTIRENTNILQNFYSPPGAFECVFRPSHEQRVIEHPLKIDGLILYRFSQPKKIGQALMELNTFCRQLDETALKEFWVSTGSKDAKDFINRLDFLALHKIKQLLWEGLLEFQV